MTNPEPAGAGTAETWESARQIATRFFEGAGLNHIVNHDALTILIYSAITAAESRAMERCAKIAEAQADIIGALPQSPIHTALVVAAAAIRKSANA